MPYEQHPRQSENVHRTESEHGNRSSNIYAADTSVAQELAAAKTHDPNFKLQEYVFARLSTTERLATATLREAQRQASAEDRILKVVTDDLSALRETGAESRRLIEKAARKADDVSRRMDDFYEVLNSLAKFQRQLDEIEAQVSDVRRGLETYEARLISLEESSRRGLSAIEDRLAPLEARVAILTSPTLFFRAVGRRLKKRVAQVWNRMVGR